MGQVDQKPKPSNSKIKRSKDQKIKINRSQPSAAPGGHAEPWRGTERQGQEPLVQVGYQTKTIS
jgi:hypothetical protein